MSGFYGGCEGGASQSTFVIIDGHGTLLAEVKGEGTNQWMIGLEECCSRIQGLVKEAKMAAGINKPLDSIGLSLSGADSAENMKDITDTFMTSYPTSSLTCFTCNDSFAPLFTATDGGGIVLIAGTGSNCLLVNHSGGTINCGGWGYLLGDEGSAFWIVSQALKIIYNHTDGLNLSQHNVNYLKKAMFEYFDMQDMFGILQHLYPSNGKQLNKEFLAKFCMKGVVAGAVEGDALSLHLLFEAGKELGKHVKALIPKMETELFHAPGGLKIVCVGSVWKSWEYLKDGFLLGITPQTDEEKQLSEFSLLTLKTGGRAAIGAAAWAAKKAGKNIHINYDNMSRVFFNHRF